MQNHGRLDLGLKAEDVRRGTKTVITVTVIEKETLKEVSSAIDVAYIESGKPFVRKADELWNKGPRIQCPVCTEEHLLSLSLIHALVLLGEGMVKAQLALAMPNLNLN